MRGIVLWGVLCFAVILTSVGWSEPGAEAKAHYDAGVAARQAKSYDKAIEELRKAVDIDKDYLDAHWVLAWVYVAKEQKELAAEQFREVIRIAPDTDKAKQAAKALERMGLPVSTAAATPPAAPPPTAHEAAAVPANVICVNGENGNDNNTGTSWDKAKKTVTAGLAAANPGGEVWVAAGVYVELITLKEDVGLYGGFAGTETTRDQRDIVKHVTVLDGNQSGCVVTAPAGLSRSAVIDGFTIRNGSAGGVGIGNSSPVISHNVVTGNSAVCGGGIGGSGGPLISSNVIIGNTATQYGSGVEFDSSGTAQIVGNRILRNRGGCAAVFINTGLSPLIADNVIADNSGAAGILCCGGQAPVVNNTIVGNDMQGFAGNFACFAELINNIIAFNKQDGVDAVPAARLRLSHNCVYGNAPGRDYHGPVQPGPDDISQDPLFVDNDAGDFHLKPGSPCIDKGQADVEGQPPVNVGWRKRHFGTSVDIGAYEFQGAAATAPPAAH